MSEEVETPSQEESIEALTAADDTGTVPDELENPGPDASGAEALPETDLTEAAVSKSLHDQIGGEETLHQIVTILSEKLQADPRINYILFGISRTDQGEKHKAFLSAALNGSEDHGVSDLSAAFDRFFQQGLKDRHFDAFFQHLRDALSELEISDDLSGAVISASENIRKKLFNR